MAAPVRTGEELELHVDSLAYGGNGVARLNGFVVFVRRGLPGDTVRARVTKVKRGFAEATMLEVLSPGPDRVVAPCPHFGACGGCRFQDYAYDKQLEAKEAQVRDALTRLGRHRESAGRGDRARRLAVRLSQQARVLVHADRGWAGARLPSRRTLGRGAPDRGLPADDRSRERDPRRRAGVGARGEARGVRPGDPEGLPPPSRPARGPQHGPGARAARHRARARSSRRGT